MNWLRDCIVGILEKVNDGEYHYPVRESPNHFELDIDEVVDDILSCAAMVDYDNRLIELIQQYLHEVPKDDGDEIYGSYHDHAELQLIWFMYWLETGELLQGDHSYAASEEEKEWREKFENLVGEGLTDEEMETERMAADCPQ